MPDLPQDVAPERIDWIPVHQVPALIADSQILAATTAAALLVLRHRHPARHDAERPGDTGSSRTAREQNH